MAKQIIQEQSEKTPLKPLLQDSEDNSRRIKYKIEAAVTMKKSQWKRRINDKVQNKIQESVEKKMGNKNKLRTVREDKQERKE